MAFLNIDGFDFHYEVYEGLVDSDTLLIHGNLACSIWWHPMIEVLQSKNPLANKKGRLVCADWRGCGKSKGIKQKSDIDFNRFADDYIQLIDFLKLKNINVVGHSTGGLIAMLAILKKPDLFSSCVLLDSIGPRGIIPPLPLDQLLAHFHALSLDEDLCNRTIAATIDGVDTTTEYFKKLAKATFGVDDPIWVGVPENLCTQIDIVHRMQDLKLPVLILHGERDFVLPLEGSKEMHELIVGSKFKPLKDQGHSFNVENPNAFVNELESFYQEML